MIITVTNICRTFGKTCAADHVSFTFSSGKIFGFIGPNGAGKTTTLRIMATLDMPDSGDVLFDDVSVVDYPEHARGLLGYMPDSLPAFSDIRVWEYLDFFARCFGLRGERRRRMLSDVEEFTGLGELREKYLASLSKGMKQRVSLARALVHDPAVLLLDEPAAGLDPRARLDLRNLLKIISEQGKAILLSSHILSELQDICDGAVIIEKGKVLAAGSMDEIYARADDADTTDTTDDAAAPPPLPGAKKSKSPVVVTIVIKTLRDAPLLRARLLEDPTVASAEDTGDTEVRAVIRGGEEAIPPVMARVFAAGLPVVGFERRHIELEEVFMRVTTGRVQ